MSSYSWSQDRRSMEYSVENQIANRLIAMGEEKNSSFTKILSWTQTFVAFHSFNFEGKTFQLNFGQCSLLSAMWHVTSVMWYIQTSDIWNIMYYRDILQICLFESPCFESIFKIPPPSHPSQTKKNLAEAEICLVTNFYQYKRVELIPQQGGLYTKTWQNLPDLENCFSETLD